MDSRLTITLDHERLHDVVTDHLEIGVTNPMTDSGLRSGKEVVKDGHLMSEEHETVNKVRADKASASSDKDTLPLRGSEELDRREARERRVGDGLGNWVVDRLGPVESRLVLHLVVLDRCAADGPDIVCSQVERPQGIERNLAVEAEASKPGGRYLLPALVESTHLL